MNLKSCKQRKNCNLSDKVVEYILNRELDEFESLSVKTIARDLNIKRFNLWRCFKQEKEITAEEFIFRIKINKAALLLQNREDLKVKEIGEKIGYCSYGYFIHIFKKYFGVTPGRYRELTTKNT